MLRLIFNLMLLFAFIGMLVAGSVVWYLLPDLPETEALRQVRLQTPLRVYSQDQRLIAEFGEKRRRPVAIEQVPATLVQAFLSSEDNRFYEHPGVDWQGITRAVINELMHGNRSQGGSTITMQVARNFFLTREKSYIRKLREILLAFRIEQDLNKDEILELYLNKIYLGHRSYGIGAAAQVYYGADLNQLTLPQMAMIAGLPKAPSTLNPVTNPERARQRRDYVLGRMLLDGHIDKPTHDEAVASPVTAQLHAPTVELEAPYVAEMVRSWMLERYGEDSYTQGYSVQVSLDSEQQQAANRALRNALNDYDRRHGYRGPEAQLKLPQQLEVSTLAPLVSPHPPVGDLMAAIVTQVDERSVRAYSREQGWILIDWDGLDWARPYISTDRRGSAPKNAAEILSPGALIRVETLPDWRYRLAELPQVEGALVALDPNSGAIRALSGGFDFNQSKFNRVTQAKRQPGSNFKPFIYSAALEKGYTAASLINDAPIVFDEPGMATAWRPENYSGKYFGPTRLRMALYKSRNLVSIRLLRAIGIEYAIDYAKRFGFAAEDLPASLSLALGSTTLTPLDVVGGFGVFANGGYEVHPYLIQSVRDYTDELIYQANPVTVCPDCDSEILEMEGRQKALLVIDPRNAWLMTSILRDTIKRGTGRKALALGRADLAGKTGTTNEQVDAWFSGFNSDLVATAWVGFDQSAPLGRLETGARAALPMWIDFMRTALQDTDEHTMQQPSGIVTARIDPATGKRAPVHAEGAMLEYFREEFIPARADSSFNGSPVATPYDSPSAEDQLF